MKHVLRWNTLGVPLLFALLWCVLMVTLYTQALRAKNTHNTELALIQTRTLYAHIVETRAWNALHGGVYVLESDFGQPNIWIPEHLRTIKTVDDRTLVLVNPAYMTRQIADLASVKGSSFRITSNEPLRPENASDAWEKNALNLCLQSLPEVFTLENTSNGPRYRYMAPLRADKSCLTCHTNNKLNDVRGGISVTLDAEPFMTNTHDYNRSLGFAYALLGLTGMLGIGGTTLGMSYKRALAEEANRMKSTFLANMSHDMRTPLNGILGMAEVLSNLPATPHQPSAADLSLRQKALRYLHETTSTLLEMVTDLTDHAVLDAEKLHIRPKPYAVHEMVDLCCSVFKPVCKAKDLQFTWQVDDSVPPVLVGDSFRLRQALGNLISNAVKFTPQGSIRVQVWFSPESSANTKGATDSAQPDPLTLASAGPIPTGPTQTVPAQAGSAQTVSPCTPPTQGVLYIAVHDTGQGIAPAEHERIFERFERGTVAVHEGMSGTGLGLGISREVARLMHGDVRVASEEGKGATFTLEVVQSYPPTAHPLSGEFSLGDSSAHPQAGKVPQLPFQPSSPLPERKDKHIVLAEDNAVSSFYIIHVLEQAGYTVSHVRDGSSALELLACKPAHALILDLRMPILDGLAVAEKVRHDPNTAALPIVVHTASLVEEERDTLLALGITAYVLKPVPANALVCSIDKALGLQTPSITTPFENAPVIQPVSPPVGQPANSIFDSSAALEDLAQDPTNPADRAVAHKLLNRLCEVFRADLPQQLEDLRHAVSTGDCPSAQRMGHALKNSAGTLHATHLRDAGASMEKCTPVTMSAILTRVEHCVEELTAVLDASHTQHPKL